MEGKRMIFFVGVGINVLRLLLRIRWPKWDTFPYSHSFSEPAAVDQKKRQE